MKIIRTIYNDYIEILNDIALDKMNKAYIKEEYTELPKEAMPTNEELNLIKEVDKKLESFKSKVVNECKFAVVPAKCYKDWTFISNHVKLDDYICEDFRNTSIEYDIDEENSLTAFFMIDLDNRKFYVELRQSGMALPYCFENTDDLDKAIEIISNYINRPEEFADYL